MVAARRLMPCVKTFVSPPTPPLADSSAVPRGERRYQALLPTRGVLAVAVILHHIKGIDFGIDTARVVMFFVISGYGIFGAVQASLNAESGAARFIVRRAKRIWPPVAGALLLLVLMRYGLGYHYAGWRHEIEPQAWPMHLTLTSWIAGLGSGNPPWTNRAWVTGPHWTLGYEVQFYALMALILIVGGMRQIRLLTVALALILIGLVQNLCFPGRFSGTLADYSACFGMGGLIYVVLAREQTRTHRLWSMVGLCGIALVTAALGWNGAGQTDLASGMFKNLALASCGACGLILAYPLDRFWNRLWIAPALNALGTISYSLFLVNPVIGPMARQWTERLLPADPPEWVWMGVYLGIQIAVAAGFWWLVERPFSPRRTRG